MWKKQRQTSGGLFRLGFRLFLQTILWEQFLAHFINDQIPGREHEQKSKETMDSMNRSKGATDWNIIIFIMFKIKDKFENFGKDLKFIKIEPNRNSIIKTYRWKCRTQLIGLAKSYCVWRQNSELVRRKVRRKYVKMQQWEIQERGKRHRRYGEKV